MKKISAMRITAIITLVFSTSMSCSLNDSESLPSGDTPIAGIVSKEANLSTLAVALERANLNAPLNGVGSFTLLAPTNAAFDAFLSTNGYGSVADIPIETLQQLLRNHVFSGRIEAASMTALKRSYLVSAADGPSTGSFLSTYFDATNGIIFNGTSKITQADISATNGIVHIVDDVIDFPTLDTFISVDGNLADMEAALEIVAAQSDLPGMLADAEAGPFTIFAPINPAFDNLLDSNDSWTTLSDIDETYLTSIMEHHVILGNIRAADINLGDTKTTLEGDDITFSSLDGSLKIKDGAGNGGAVVGIFNIQAVNGVIHLLLSQVLLPDTTN